MKEYPDDELDGLFRKSAEEFEPPYDPSDWQDLRKRLDADDRSPLGGMLRSGWPWLVLLLLLIGGVGVYYVVSTSGSAASREGTLSTSQVAEVPAEVKALEKSTPAKKEISSLSEPRDATLPTTAPYSTLEAKKEIAQAPLGQKTLPRRVPNVSGVREEPARPQAGRSTGVPVVPQTTLPVLRAEVPLAALPNEPIAQPDETNPEPRLALSTPASLLPVGYDFSGPDVEPRSVTPPPQVPENEEASTARFTPQWAIRLGISPDLSSVGMSRFVAPRAAGSLLVDYAIMPRVHVQSGVIRSLKEYRALPHQYEWPEYWKQSIMPTSVDGTCQVFEVPLNVRYTLSQRERSGWSVGLGVSSYRMQKEVYNYNYPRKDPGIKWYSWKGKTGWYWGSHLNASVGYEYWISRRLSLVAEPYARIPLRRVGLGKVNLFTVGTWMSVRYTPAFR